MSPRRTLTLEQYRKSKRHGKLGIDGTRVCVLHPDAPTQIVEMNHRTEAEAEATFKKVQREYFNPRHGWAPWLDQPDYLDTSNWIPPEPEPPTPEEIAAAEARERGWLLDGAALVLSLSRNRSASDLEMALARAAPGVTALHVIVSEDDDGARERLFDHLIAGAAPDVTTLTLERTWAPNELANLSLAGLADVLKKRRLDRIGALGTFAWPATRLPGLTHVRLHNAALTATDIARIGHLPDVRAIQLRMPKRTGEAHEAALAALPLGQLDELAVEYVEFGWLLTALLDAGRRAGGGLPKRVHLHGLPGPTGRTAIERWLREVPDSELTFGADVAPNLQGLRVAFRDSPFDDNAARFAPFR